MDVPGGNTPERGICYRKWAIAQVSSGEKKMPLAEGGYSVVRRGGLARPGLVEILVVFLHERRGKAGR